MKPQRQSLTISQPLTRDTTELRVSNADGGTFILMYLNPVSMEYVLSEAVVTGCSAGDLKNAIADYYRDLFGTRPVVTKTCIGYEDLEVSCSAAAEEIRDHIYSITVPRSISMASTTQIMAVPLDSWSSIVVTLPENK